jgi:hypothetical protein
MLTRSEAEIRSSESIKQHKSMSALVEMRERHRGDRVLGRTRTSETESVSGAPEGQETAVGLYGSDEPFE